MVFINILLVRRLGAVMISKISLGIYALHKAPRRNSGNQMNRFIRNVLGGPRVFILMWLRSSGLTDIDKLCKLKFTFVLKHNYLYSLFQT